jgi:tetratricopeptide (TPR) repeat protein
MNKNSNINWSLIICLVLAIIAFIIYYQVHSFEFVNYDDNTYVYANPSIQAGITFKAVKWAFTSGYADNWHPLTWLSHMLDWQLFGANAEGHHIINLIFHILNTLLVFIVFKKMTNVLWQSAFVAALFALHPLHVESVAWIAERKDVLSTFFWLLAMWAYVRYVEQPKVARYLWIVVFFALGLMSKPMLVTLPFVFLILDYWPLNRLGSKRSLVYLLIEKIPLFMMTAAGCVATFITQKESGAMRLTKDLSFPLQLANASISYMQYIIKMIWPSRLAVFYPHSGRDISILYAVVSAVVLLTVTILVIRFAKNHRYLFTGWFWYLGTLVPVIGLVQVGRQSMADRYTYITLTGLFIIIAWGLSELLAKWRYKKIVFVSSAILVVSALSLCTYFQIRYWRNSLTLFQHALEVTNNNYVAHYCIADPLIAQGRLDEAIYHYSQAIRIEPDYAGALNDLGAVLYKEGKTDEAIGYYNRALKADPSLASTHLSLAAALESKGNLDEAAEHYKIGLADKDIPEIRRNFGSILVKLGRFEEAAGEYRKILSVTPDDPNILSDLSFILTRTGKFDEAITLCNKALQIAPDSINTHLNLGAALVSSGRLDEAVKEYEKILQIQPKNARAHNDLGVILSQQKKFDQAIAHFNQSLQIDPDYIDARNNLSVALAENDKLKSTENTKKK